MSTARRNNEDKLLGRGRAVPFLSRLEKLPYWLIATLILGLIIIWQIASSAHYAQIFSTLASGIATTLKVSVIAYVCAILLGLGIGLLRVSKFRLLRELGTFYVEVIRGIPMLVILYVITFALAPMFASAINAMASPFTHGAAIISLRDVSYELRATIALVIGYSAFIAEIFRAGIESLPRGQMEAASALGLSRAQAMRHVILPQAIKAVLPPLGNELVAIVKDSSLVSVLGVQDITGLGKVYAASSFEFFDTYTTMAYLYLILTLTMSLLVRVLEKRFRRGQSHELRS